MRQKNDENARRKFTIKKKVSKTSKQYYQIVFNSIRNGQSLYPQISRAIRRIVIVIIDSRHTNKTRALNNICSTIHTL